MRRERNELEDVKVTWRDKPYFGRYKATRRKDGWHYIEVRMGFMSTRTYMDPKNVEFDRPVELVYVDKVGQYGEVLPVSGSVPVV